jgi:transposase
MGDTCLRQLLVVGSAALIRSAKSRPEKVGARFLPLLVSKLARVASVGNSIEIARITCATIARGGVFECGHAPTLAA